MEGVEYRFGSLVLWGVFSTVGGTISAVEGYHQFYGGTDTISTVESGQLSEIPSVLERDTINTVL